VPQHNANLYGLSTGKSITSLSDFTQPLDEYEAAFAVRESPFLIHYRSENGSMYKYTLSRGEFWDLACSAATHLREQRLSKGDRIVHGFSSNSPYDLLFRLADVMTGCVPVTINWQADDDERVIYKTKLTKAKLMIFDDGFANRLEAIKSGLPGVRFLEVGKFEARRSAALSTFPSISYEDERMIIFTSGTTGKPKGVSLSHRSYLANRLTFEQYFGMSPNTRLDVLLVNPLHHTNSSALADWAMRRSGAIIHLIDRYSTAYWEILTEVANKRRELLVTALVSRHIDFLEALSRKGELPVDEAKLKHALRQTDILIGSAPVGPTTIKHILDLIGRLPCVRFGSTETCLQVMATPRTLSHAELMETFRAGWSHCYQGERAIGYYIGREHFPFTRVKVVKAINLDSKDYFRPCEIGEPGYLITQGPNIMDGYVGDPEATKAVFREGWYTGLRDIAFTIKNNRDQQLDYYWVSRDSELLIRGGANYAYDQIAAELSKVLAEHFQLKPEQFKLAVVGLRLESEHEDSCCVTIELSPRVAAIASKLRASFIAQSSRIVPKWARPERLRLAQIPLTFKGAVLYPQLKQDFLDSLKGDS